VLYFIEKLKQKVHISNVLKKPPLLRTFSLFLSAKASKFPAERLGAQCS
jgi:hypothetical protein